MEERETSLEDSVEVAFDAVRLIASNPNLSEEEAKQQVKAVLTNIRYGSDGYFSLMMLRARTWCIRSSLSW